MSAVRDDDCQNGALADMAALAMQVQNPVSPYPLFYSTSSCGGGVTNGAFPEYFFNSSCPNDPMDPNPIPKVTDNCLRVITDYDGSFTPFTGGALDPRQVNVLPGGQDQKGNVPTGFTGNIFSDGSARLFSFFIPENFYIVFYRGNPMTQTRDLAAAQGVLQINGNTVIPNACIDTPTLTNGLPFMTPVAAQCTSCSSGCCRFDTTFNQCVDAGSFCNDFNDCREAFCGACGNSGAVPQGDTCIKGGTYRSCPAVYHNAPYFVVVQTGDFADTIIDMCVNNGIHAVGRNSLNRVWRPQSAGCDQYMTSICNISNLPDSPFNEICSCYTQQIALNNEYTAALGVPVCCFGFDVTNPSDIAKSCAFNMKAYKTAFMASNCCSPAICQTVLDNNTDIKVKTTPPGQIYCAGTFIEYPVVPVPVPNASSILIAVSSAIPFYTWIVFIVGVVLLLLFVLALAFV